MPIPVTAVVHRREPEVPLTWTPATLNVRVPVGVNPQQAPDPIRASDFYLDGKPRIHAVSHVQRAVALAIAPIQSISEQTFMTEKALFTLQADTTRGTQIPMAERANIEKAQSTAYGNKHAVQGYSPGILYPGGRGHVAYGWRLSQ